MILRHIHSSIVPLITASCILLISNSLLKLCLSFKRTLSRAERVSLTCAWMNLNSSSHSFFKIFPKRVTSWSSLR
jgi:hypothetical protein